MKIFNLLLAGQLFFGPYVVAATAQTSTPYRVSDSVSSPPKEVNLIGFRDSDQFPDIAVLEVEACNKFFEFPIAKSKLKNKKELEKFLDRVVLKIKEECDW